MIRHGFVGAFREGMRLLGFDCGQPRLPNLPLPEEKRAQPARPTSRSLAWRIWPRCEATTMTTSELMTPARVDTLLATYSDGLLNSTLPFWFPRSIE